MWLLNFISMGKELVLASLQSFSCYSIPRLVEQIRINGLFTIQSSHLTNQLLAPNSPSKMVLENSSQEPGEKRHTYHGLKKLKGDGPIANSDGYKESLRKIIVDYLNGNICDGRRGNTLLL